MYWNSYLSDLQFHLATLFPLKDDILSIAVRAGLSPAHLTVSDKGILFWHHVLTAARQQGLLDEIIAEARRIFPEDGVLKNFNAKMVDSDHGVRPEMLKQLFEDILREGTLRGALPILEELLQRSPSAASLEEEVVVRFAEVSRHQKNTERFSGKKRSASMQAYEASMSELIASVQAL